MSKTETTRRFRRLLGRAEDAVKIIARNMFYQLLRLFRPLYDNYRDDHAVLRNLTHASATVLFATPIVEVTLHPTMQYPTHIRRVMAQFLDHINRQAIPIPDGSDRTIRFALSQNASKLSAIDPGQKQAIY